MNNRLLPIAVALGVAATSAYAQRPARVPAHRPDLVVLITVDQMRPDYFTRFLPQLTGGLGRLYRGGSVFTNAFQDHAITETAPGHSVIGSGRFPVHTGIAMNSAGVNDSTEALVRAPGLGASPKRFLGTTLTDWIRATDPQSRSLSVSRKDRGAILPIGKSKSSVYWYAPNGTFTTSRYYADSLPNWLNVFNAERRPQSFVGKTWNPILPGSAYSEPDSMKIENGGRDIAFPHVMTSDTTRELADLPSFPWMDQITLEAALAGVRAMKLGAGPHTDVLAISLSTTDAIGHAFGPDSKEQHDQILRLDRSLGAFLDSLYAIRDPRTVVLALTADHAVAPYPEIHDGRDNNAGATHVELGPIVQAVRTSLASAGVPRSAFTFGDGVLTVDRNALATAHVNADSLIGAFRATILRVPGVRRADRIAELEHADTVHDDIARRWLHMFDSDSVAALVVTLTPYSYWGRGGSAEHGSPYDYDAHVPLIFYGAPFKPGKYAERALVADIAPTLARVVGVRSLEKTDGVALTVELKQRSTERSTAVR
ncbi:MAG: alkaline phosphatase family protein [Gemmatimonadaceae bacterium]